MSDYLRETKHPTTGEWEMAYWLDDYFGPHKYGVRFPGSPDVFDPRKVELVTREAEDDREDVL